MNALSHFTNFMCNKKCIELLPKVSLTTYVSSECFIFSGLLGGGVKIYPVNMALHLSRL